MAETTASNYLILGPAILALVGVWIVVGSIGARIARKHAETRSTGDCPECQTKLQVAGLDLRYRIVSLIFLVDVTRYSCGQCGFRQSVWKA